MRKAIESFERFCAIRKDTCAAEQTEPADATIGKNLEPHMSCHARRLKLSENVPVIGFQLGVGEHFLPGERRSI